MKKIIVSTLLLSMLIACSAFSVLPKNQEITRSQFIGTWINEEDFGNQWVFDNQHLTIKHEGYDNDVYSYNISTSSPQCGIEINTTTGDHYLQITKVDDPDDKTCFLINGFAEVTIGRKTLSISQVDRGGFSIFVKQ